MDKDYFIKWRAAHPNYHKNWRKANDVSVKETNKKAARKCRLWIRELLDTIKTKYGCQNPSCPCTGPLPSFCLDFHHLDKTAKSFNVGCTITKKAILIDEINKCVVLCAVCHRMETYGCLDVSGYNKCSIDLDGNILTESR